MARKSKQSRFQADLAGLPVEIAAQKLVGATLADDEIVLRITEVEAYGGQEDSASHARFGKTSRNEPMFGPAGRAYVYLCYGIHQMLNVVVGRENEPAAVLIRSVEVKSGLELVLARRKQKASAQLVTGPGKVGQALAIDGSWNHYDLLDGPGLKLTPGKSRVELGCGPRIGIDYADPTDVQRPWRFADIGSAAVKDRKKLIRRS